MENLDTILKTAMERIDPKGILNNWAISTPDGDLGLYEYFQKKSDESYEKMKQTDEYKRLNLFEDLVEKFPLAEIRAKRERGEALSFLENVVVFHHYNTAAKSITAIAIDRPGLTAIAKELSEIAENAKFNSLHLPVDEINAQIKEVVPYMTSAHGKIF